MFAFERLLFPSPSESNFPKKFKLYRAGSIEKIVDPYKRELALTIWIESITAPPHFGAPKWIHGDLLQSNLLFENDKLTAVIDFGLLGAGDPACDLMAGWTLFDAQARETYRLSTEVDDATWLRGRGWALAFAAVAYPYYESLGHPLATVASRTLNAVLASPLQSSLARQQN